MAAKMTNSEINYNLTDFWNIFEPPSNEDSHVENAGHGNFVIDELDLVNFLRESGHLRSVFPEEIWTRILGQITAPEDLLSLSNSSPYFRHLLQEHRVTFLFHKVIEALAPQYEKGGAPSCYREEEVPVVPKARFAYYYSDDDDEAGYYYDDSDEYSDCYFTSEDEDVYLEPDVFFEEDQWHYFSGRESSRCRLKKTVIVPHAMTGIMKCRLVCPTWNKAVETYYQNPNKMSDEKSHVRHWEVQEFSCFVDKRKAPRRFVEHFEESHNQPLERKNPFLGRSVEINGRAPREVERGFMNSLRRALEAFGEEIWYCAIGLPIKRAMHKKESAQLYLRLKGWLGLMRNLKSLKIFGVSDSDDNKHPYLEDYEGLSVEIGGNPIARLEHLEFLDLDGLPAPMSNELIRANNHVAGLRLGRRIWEQRVRGSYLDSKYYHELGYELPGNLKNLRKLEIVPFSEELLRKLEREAWCASNVEVLEAHCSNGSAFDWERVLKVVGNKWGGTLRELTLKMGYDEGKQVDILEFGSGIELKLEKLEKLKLHLYQPIKLDFLLGVKSSLEWMTLVCKYHQEIGCDKMGGNSRIRFSELEDWIKRYNVWETFEKLKVVQVNDCSCWYCRKYQWAIFKRPVGK